MADILSSIEPEVEPEAATSDNFISLYLEYTAQTECPRFFHRWTAITSLSAYLGRRIYFHHGHFTIYPNIYAMLIGSPGTKKSSAIKIGVKLLKQSGYNTFAAKKTRQEKFLTDLAEQSERLAGIDEVDNILDQNLWGETDLDSADSYLTRPPAECFIAADEFNTFIGLSNIDFISILGDLWDYEGVYDYRLKNSKSVFIPNPTITILGGNTSTGFAQAFPAESIGQGFFSRLILVYAEPSGVKYTFPPPPDVKIQERLIALLHTIKKEVAGEMSMTSNAIELLHIIYHTWEGPDDLRFEHYSNRRLQHLIKLCLVITAARISIVINDTDVIHANTILTFTEQLMPKALGEFGKSKNSAVTHKIMTAVDHAVDIGKPISAQGLWKLVHSDLDNRQQLAEIIGNLVAADKIQSVSNGEGYLPIKKVFDESISGTLDWSILSKLERGVD